MLTANMVGQGLIILFMSVVGYGAFLVVRDADRNYKDKQRKTRQRRARYTKYE